MLSVFRKNANNWFMVVVFAVITFVFVFTFGSWGGGDLSGAVPVAATVNGHVIPMSQFKAQYSQTFRMMSAYRPGFNADKAREEKLDQTVLDQLVSRELLAQAAEERGLAVTDDELSDTIVERFFGKDKPFDADEYKRIVNGVYNTTEARFEDQMRRELLAARFETILGDAQHVSAQEIQEQFDSKSNRADLELLRIDPQFYRSKVKEASDADIAAWAGTHGTEVKAFYDEHINRFRQPKKVKARHILVKVAADASDGDKQKAKTTIDAAKKRVDGGEDFAVVAKEVSEDSSKDSGGDLGFFAPGAMVKPFEDAAFALEKGKISAVVETKFGYHVIKVEDIQDAVTKEVAEVQNEIAKELMRDAQLNAEARKVAEAALAEIQAGKTMGDVKIDGLIKPTADGAMPKPGDYDPFAPRVESTGMFAKSARAVPRVGVAPELVKLAFEQLSMEAPLAKTILEVNKRFYVVKLKGREAPDATKFAAERDGIEQGLLAGRKSAVVEQFTKMQRETAKIEQTPDLLGS